jgi:hypothetical protein
MNDLNQQLIAAKRIHKLLDTADSAKRIEEIEQQIANQQIANQQTSQQTNTSVSQNQQSPSIPQSIQEAQQALILRKQENVKTVAIALSNGLKTLAQIASATQLSPYEVAEALMRGRHLFSIFAEEATQQSTAYQMVTTIKGAIDETIIARQILFSSPSEISDSELEALGFDPNERKYDPRYTTGSEKSGFVTRDIIPGKGGRQQIVHRFDYDLANLYLRAADKIRDLEKEGDGKNSIITVYSRTEDDYED